MTIGAASSLKKGLKYIIERVKLIKESLFYVRSHFPERLVSTGFAIFEAGSLDHYHNNKCTLHTYPFSLPRLRPSNTPHVSPRSYTSYELSPFPAVILALVVSVSASGFCLGSSKKTSSYGSRTLIRSSLTTHCFNFNNKYSTLSCLYIALRTRLLYTLHS